MYEIQLSSYMTFMWKYIFSAVWAAGFGLGTLMMLFQRPMESESWAFLAAWLAGCWLLWLTVARLKCVTLHDGVLHVSNYLRRVDVPLTEIAGVEEHLMWRPMHITVRFARDTPFGSSIMFTPKWPINIWKPSLAYTELTSAVEASRIPSPPNKRIERAP